MPVTDYFGQQIDSYIISPEDKPLQVAISVSSKWDAELLFMARMEFETIKERDYVEVMYRQCYGDNLDYTYPNDVTLDIMVPQQGATGLRYAIEKIVSWPSPPTKKAIYVTGMLNQWYHDMHNSPKSRLVIPEKVYVRVKDTVIPDERFIESKLEPVFLSIIKPFTMTINDLVRFDIDSDDIDFLATHGISSLIFWAHTLRANHVVITDGSGGVTYERWRPA